MTLNWRTGTATLVVAAIVVPYLGYVVAGSMPFVGDAQDMAAIGIIFGVAAALLVGLDGFRGRWGRWATVTALGSAALGFGTLWAEAGAPSEIMLAAFVASMIAAWAFAMAASTERHVARKPLVRS